MAATFAVIVAISVAVIEAGVFAGKAGALPAGGLIASENINDLQVPIAFSTSSSPDSTWTSLGSVSLTPGASYALFASVGFRTTLTTAPSSVECELTAPNEPPDLQTTSFVGTKGANLAGLSFEGVTTLTAGPGRTTLIPGSASLQCHTWGAPANDMIIAHDARVLAIPVDAASNNLHT